MKLFQILGFVFLSSAKDIDIAGFQFIKILLRQLTDQKDPFEDLNFF